MNADAPSVVEREPVHDEKTSSQDQRAKFESRRLSAFYRFVRKTHPWVAIIVALPLLLRMLTGVALQVRKPVDWIQPTTEVGAARYEPAVSHAQILEAVKAVPEMRVEEWRDLEALDYRPKKGVIKVHNHDDLETQVDAKTGEVIRTSHRWGDFFSRIHDGTEWGMRLWFFLPTALLIIYLVFSGFYLGITESLHKIRVKRQRKEREAMLPPARGEAPALKRPFHLPSFCLRYHYWLALIVLLPWMLVTTSGLMLQLRSEIPGIDPDLRQGVSSTPSLSYPRVLEIAKTIPGLEVKEWKHIWRIYTHPVEGVITVRTKRGVRAQLDASSGEVLSVEPYSRDFWEDLHQSLIGRHELRSGSPFGSVKIDLRFWVFLPVHLISVLMWLTGVIYFLKTTLARKKPAAARAPSRVSAENDADLEPVEQPIGGD